MISPTFQMSSFTSLAWRGWPFTASVMAPLVSGPVVVAAPDPGGVKRALRWREHLQARWQQSVGFAMVDKRRVGGLVTSGQLVAGDVQGAAVLLLDDIVASGGTLAHAAAALHHAGAAMVQGFAAHGLFVGDADRLLEDIGFGRAHALPFALDVGTVRMTVKQQVPEELVSLAVKALSDNLHPAAQRDFPNFRVSQCRRPRL